ncbi:putative transcription factor RfeD [Aspergillus clavatus NRRL 1]|uniref:Transcription factor RfeD, putative n=1 Tax=Aspergillus clavatus (strain ATCC 1007 / CBS 513.65 / DSM 816 / NCTC 3887 / NRRL 1 / QM 1276 / 107) TaxID=344612 RepID=A1CEE7_ASPCL|nr:transcription factor RfeD, putative [Aspergillus clavatus NRRL 1]EAW11246.1 transcription factor RfeD, putative [Aspergillus clavatus NRRL 1]
MQEHIRRAHPNHYIPKLPATEESFILMVTTPPDQRAHLSPPIQAPSRRQNGGYRDHVRSAGVDWHHKHLTLPANADRDIYVADASSPATPRGIDEPHPAAATAAVALAQLHHHRLASDWDTDMDIHSDNDIGRDRMRSSIELPSLRDHFKQDTLPPFSSPRPRELLPSILNHSPPGRSSTLPPIQTRDKLPRPRKSSISRKMKHGRTRSKEFGRRPSLGDRKALSAEPQTAAWAQGKRWEDLIEAATSATEADDEPHSEIGRSPTIPPLISHITSVPSMAQNRSSLPPAFQSGSLPPPASHRPFQPLSYAASPLHKSLTPPPFETRSRDSDLEPFPSIESSLDSASSASGKTFGFGRNLSGSVNSDSSPVLNLFPPSASQRQHHRFSNPTPASFRNKDIQIYCASCKRPSALNDCYACTECICGVCRECVGMLMGSPPASFKNVTSSPGSAVPTGNNAGYGGPTSYPNPRGCPRCHSVTGKWKAFQLEFR